MSDYIDTYLDQEIKAEAITRNIFRFEKFLQKAALSSGQVLVLQNIANDAQLSPPTVRQYLEVLEDTLIGYYLRPWSGVKRKAIQSAKFFLFDLGVRWFLSGVESLPEQSDLFGQAFEQFVLNEIRACHSYRSNRELVYFWRTTHQDEIDIIIGDSRAIEVKASNKVSLRDARKLFKLREEGFKGQLTLVSRDPLNRAEDDIQFLHWESYFTKLWS